MCQIYYIFGLFWHGYVSSDPRPEKIQSVTGTCLMDDIVDLDSFKLGIRVRITVPDLGLGFFLNHQERYRIFNIDEGSE